MGLASESEGTAGKMGTSLRREFSPRNYTRKKKKRDRKKERKKPRSCQKFPPTMNIMVTVIIDKRNSAFQVQPILSPQFRSAPSCKVPV